MRLLVSALVGASSCVFGSLFFIGLRHRWTWASMYATYDAAAAAVAYRDLAAAAAPACCSASSAAFCCPM